MKLDVRTFFQRQPTEEVPVAQPSDLSEKLNHQCVICQTYPDGNVFSCKPQPYHFVCNSCRNGLQSTTQWDPQQRTYTTELLCPVCREPHFGSEPNLTLQELFKMMPISCPCSGCSVILPVNQMQKHTNVDCQNRPVMTLHQAQLQQLANDGIGPFETYEGQVDSDNRPHGKGTATGQVKLTCHREYCVVQPASIPEQSTFRYDGKWKHGVPDGHGTCVITYAQSVSVVHGTLRYPVIKETYKGNYQCGLPSGDGIQIQFRLTVSATTSIAKYRGKFICGKRHGIGKMKWNNCGFCYTGYWKNGKPEGYGELKSPNGIVHTGNWANGVPRGVGWDHNTRTSQITLGRWQNGTRETYIPDKNRQRVFTVMKESRSFTIVYWPKSTGDGTSEEMVNTVTVDKKHLERTTVHRLKSRVVHALGLPIEKQSWAVLGHPQQTFNQNELTVAQLEPIFQGRDSLVVVCKEITNNPTTTSSTSSVEERRWTVYRAPKRQRTENNARDTK